MPPRPICSTSRKRPSRIRPAFTWPSVARQVPRATPHTSGVVTRDIVQVAGLADRRPLRLHAGATWRRFAFRAVPRYKYAVTGWLRRPGGRRWLVGALVALAVVLGANAVRAAPDKREIEARADFA